MGARRPSCLLIIFCLTLAALWSVLPLNAQSGSARWTNPQLLAEGWFPSLTVDNTDTVHIAWHGDGDITDRLLEAERGYDDVGFRLVREL